MGPLTIVPHRLVCHSQYQRTLPFGRSIIVGMAGLQLCKYARKDAVISMQWSSWIQFNKTVFDQKWKGVISMLVKQLNQTELNWRPQRWVFSDSTYYLPNVKWNVPLSQRLLPIKARRFGPANLDLKMVRRHINKNSNNRCFKSFHFQKFRRFFYFPKPCWNHQKDELMQ